jgi:hypothetical protein
MGKVLQIESRLSYDDIWSSKSLATKYAVLYSKKTGHDVRVNYSSYYDGFSIEDVTLKKRGLSSRTVRLELYDNKPTNFVVRDMFGNTLLSIPLGVPNRKLKKVI